MSKKKKLLKKILSGGGNISFNDVKALLINLGFRLDRIKGSHHIFINPQINEIINIQSVKGQVKPYQLKQIISLIERYNLKIDLIAMNDYHINLFYSTENEGYIADIPDLPNCSAFGLSPEEALKEVLVAKATWIAAAKANHIPIPEPKYKPVIYQL